MKHKRACLSAFAILSSPALIAAQTLVKDINTATSFNSGYPGGLHSFAGGKKAVFLAYASTGRALHVTDGTTAGTDFLRGTNGFRSLCNLGNRALIAMDDGTHGEELWITDGTRLGTSMLADINPGRESARPSGFVQIGGRVLFQADDQRRAGVVWTTDGTAQGTKKVSELSSLALFRTPVRLGTKVLFSNQDATHGRELWQTDGTAAGTSLLKDLIPGSGSGFPTGLIVVGNRVMFHSYNDLWTTDGTTAGTKRLRGFAGRLTAMTAFGNLLLFIGTTQATGAEVWRSDGTVAGTTLLKDIAPGSNPGPLRGSISIAGNRALFFADDRVHGHEPWVTDGTEAGTRMLKDLNLNSSYVQGDVRFVTIGGVSYFQGVDAAHGAELWQTDGTPAGTQLVQDINPGVPSSMPQSLADLDGNLVFSAIDPRLGTELFIKPANQAPRLLKDLRPDSTSNSIPHMLAELDDGSALFLAVDGYPTNNELWRTDGTAAGTQKLKDIGPGNASGFVGTTLDWARYRGNVYFSANDGIAGLEPWRSDGTSAGTQRWLDIAPGAAGSSPLWFATFRDKLWFRTGTGTGTGGLATLHVSDGTAAGTTVFARLPAEKFRIVNGIAYFMSRLGTTTTLYRTDGTVPGTWPVTTLPGTNPHGEFVATAQQLFFTLDGGLAAGLELFRSDGTAAGTRQVMDINPGIASSFPVALTPFGNRVAFRALAAIGYEPWVSDGTTAGTYHLGDLNPGVAHSNPVFVESGGQVFFTADDGKHGRELWRSDGTSAGTAMVSDLFPGSNSGADSFLNPAGVGGRVLFSGDAGTGFEPFVSDGTAAGTRLLGELVPGGAGSAPRGFFAASDRYYFMARTPATGFELFMVKMQNVGASHFAGPGYGCPGTGGISPRIHGTGNPALGSTSFAVHLTRARANAVCGLAIGTGRGGAALGGGCRLWVDPLVLLLFSRTDGAGAYELKTSIPHVPALVGSSIYFTGFADDPQGRFAGSISLTGGLHKVIGR